MFFLCIYLFYLWTLYTYMNIIIYVCSYYYYYYIMQIPFCENHPPKDDIWSKENVSVWASREYGGMMKMGNILHYFIPKQNLLKGIPVRLLHQYFVGELEIRNEDAKTHCGRVYEEIINQTHKNDRFLQYLSDLWKPTLQQITGDWRLEIITLCCVYEI